MSPAGVFELLSGDGEAVLDFEMGDSAYRNPMAVPVGTYTLRQIEAAEGYVLQNSEITVEIPPYLTQGGSVASAACAVCLCRKARRSKGCSTTYTPPTRRG